MIRGIVFDIGGVLAYDVMEYLFEFKNCVVVEKYQLDSKIVAETAAVLWRKYAHTSEDLEESWQDQEKDFWEEFKQKTGLNAGTADLIQLSKEYFRPVSGMVDLLAWLHRERFDLLICSNNAEFLYHRQKQSAGFAKFFEKRKIILSNHFGVSKHEPSFTMFKAVEKQMEYSKEEYLFIDDRKKNIDAALQFGITPILFPAEASYGHTYIKAIIQKVNCI